MGRFRFSNFQAAGVRCEMGIEYPSVEHAYQAMKSLDRGERLAIAALGSPAAAKRASRKVTLRPGWEDVKQKVMLGLLRQKFAPGTPFAQDLLSTGAEELAEWNFWHDRVWGRCTCPRCGGRGENLLGQALMRVREELKRG